MNKAKDDLEKLANKSMKTLYKDYGVEPICFLQTYNTAFYKQYLREINKTGKFSARVGREIEMWYNALDVTVRYYRHAEWRNRK